MALTPPVIFIDGTWEEVIQSLLTIPSEYGFTPIAVNDDQGTYAVKFCVEDSYIDSVVGYFNVTGNSPNKIISRGSSFNIGLLQYQSPYPNRSGDIRNSTTGGVHAAPHEFRVMLGMIVSTVRNFGISVGILPAFAYYSAVNTISVRYYSDADSSAQDEYSVKLPGINMDVSGGPFPVQAANTPLYTADASQIPYLPPFFMWDSKILAGLYSGQIYLASGGFA